MERVLAIIEDRINDHFERFGSHGDIAVISYDLWSTLLKQEDVDTNSYIFQAPGGFVEVICDDSIPLGTVHFMNSWEV